MSPECPGSIHEGGELGYSLSHAFGAVFDNPGLMVACVIGDGEAETGPLATAWHSNKFLDPATDGAVLPILHLNGYKIANPTVLARIARDELTQLLRGCGWEPHFVEGHEPQTMHQAHGSDARHGHASRSGRSSATRARRRRQRPAALADDRAAHAQGLDRAESASTALPVEGTFPRASGAPAGGPRAHRSICKLLEQWMRSYRPEELFDEQRPSASPSWRNWRPRGERRMGANPNANGGMLLRDLRAAGVPRYAVAGAAARHRRSAIRACWGRSCGM